MRTFVLVLVIASLCIGPADSVAQKKGTTPPPNLVGTWRLVSYNDPSDENGKWSNYPETVLYEKYITPTHFLWVRYEKDKDQLVGMGGGTYTYTGDKYVETIEFFMPSTSSIAGQTITFSANFKDGKWHHSGYAMDNQFDPGKARTAVVDSVLIEEIWEKVPATTTNMQNLLGTWQLVSYKEKESGPTMSYPGFVQYVKLITPTHFAWVQYNEDGDDVSGAGCGTYVFDGKSYVENVHMIYPAGSPLTGSSITFNFEMKGNRWLHSVSSVEKDGQPVPDIYIKEEWMRYWKR